MASIWYWSIQLILLIVAVVYLFMKQRGGQHHDYEQEKEFLAGGWRTITRIHPQRILVALAALIGIGTVFFPWIYAPQSIFDIKHVNQINLIKRGFAPGTSAILYAAYLPWREIVPLGWTNLFLFGVTLSGCFLGNRQRPLRGWQRSIVGIPALVATAVGMLHVLHWRSLVRASSYVGKAPYVLVLASLFIVAATLVPRNWNTLFQRYLHATGRAFDVNFLIRELGQDSPRVHQRAATKLEKLGPSALSALRKALRSADESRIRCQAAEILGRMGDVEAVALLVDALEDADADVRQQAALALIHLNWEPQDTQERDQYSFALQDWDAFISRGLPGVEVLNAFRPNYPDMHAMIDDVIQKMCGTITAVTFGAVEQRVLMRFVQQEVLVSPDISTLPPSLPRLARILNHLPTHDFYQIERFLTYLVNSLGQGYLKRRVSVELYGDSELFHPHLFNNIKNLCKEVVMQGAAG